jgi:low temperature requirement protein LtrA
MVAGIIVAAVGDELVIAHPNGSTDAATAAVVLGGPALFLAGHALFKWAVFGGVSISRLATIVAPAALAPMSLIIPPLALAAAATLVVAAVAAWDARAPRLPAQETPGEPSFPA